ncbi:ABC transporter permease subunit [Paenibacillus turpanensis]|uniref:ABC transporter permease subunit n=1 Tax=Paenibacillus turpanensis TaxID=2689078 RepID=UPI0014086D08|nr:ABC transporter permease subunit [Paenibacillus turpanensis]
MSSIIGMTWKEMLRKRVLLLTLIMTAVFLTGFWYVARTIGMEFMDKHMEPGSIEYTLAEFRNGSIILSLGFFFGTFVIAFLSIFSSLSVVAGEAEQGVLQALLPRPIARWKWYLGRWIGYVSLGIVYSAILFALLLYITDIYSGIPRDFLVLLKAFGILAWIVPLLVSVSMLGSCYFPAFGNGVFMIMLYAVGWIGGIIDKMSAIFSDEAQQSLQLVQGIASMLMPTDMLQRRMLSELFYMKEFNGIIREMDLGPFGIGIPPSNTFLLYCALYTVIGLALGIRAFHKKDL